MVLRATRLFLLVGIVMVTTAAPASAAGPGVLPPGTYPFRSYGSESGLGSLAAERLERRLATYSRAAGEVVRAATRRVSLRGKGASSSRFVSAGRNCWVGVAARASSAPETLIARMRHSIADVVAAELEVLSSREQNVVRWPERRDASAAG